MFVLVVFYYRIIIASYVRASLSERNPKSSFPTLAVQQINTSVFKRFHPKRVFPLPPTLSPCTCQCRNCRLGWGRRTRSGAGSSGAARRGSGPAVATRSGSGDAWTCRRRPLLPDGSACEPPEEGFASPWAVMPLCSGARSVVQLAGVVKAEAGWGV